MKSFDKHAVEVLLVNLFPPASFLTSSHSYPSERKHGASGYRGATYRRRLFTEHLLPNEPRDQDVLGLIRQGDRVLKKLASRITADEPFAQLFEYLGGGLKKESLLNILSYVHDELRKKLGNRADLQAAEGSFAPWRLASRFASDEHCQKWLIEELIKCLPGHLRLLHSIYYFWLGTGQHSFEERKPVRAAVLAKARKVFGELSVEKFCESFDPTFPYTLFHLVFTSDYQRPDTVPLGTPADWSWLGPIVWRAFETCPSVAMPQFLVAANALETRGGEQIRYKFHELLLEAWFPGRETELFECIVGWDPKIENLDPNAQAYVRAGLAEAKRRLSESQKSR